MENEFGKPILNRRQKELLMAMAQITEKEAQQVFDICKKENLFEVWKYAKSKLWFCLERPRQGFGFPRKSRQVDRR